MQIADILVVRARFHQEVINASMPRGEQLDLLLLHAPSVYDFRKMSILYGPISHLIPSSTVFEMYPLGFLTIASYLRAQGVRVRIVNLAVRMMKDRKFSVPRFLASQHPKAIGIDLHWLPHAHGALEVARPSASRQNDSLICQATLFFVSSFAG